MRKKWIINFLITVALLNAISCSTQNDISLTEIDHIIDQIKEENAPDKRVEIFDITYEVSNKTLKIMGESTTKSGVKQLINKIEGHGLIISNEVEELPSHDLGDSIYALVNNSVGNIRSDSKHSAELATQALLGTPLKVLKRDSSREWYLVQTPDKYISWIDHGAIKLVTKDEILKWKNTAKVVYQKISGFSYANPHSSKTVSDLVFGNILIAISNKGNRIKVRYPDGRIAFVKKNEVISYQKWLSQSPDFTSILSKSIEMIGFPYLWGGTSSKGIDCSGLTKMAYLAAGLIIPRDASQQVNEGSLIDTKGNFELLEPGDLLFFGRPKTDSTKERIVHVGLWMGNNKMIHSSGKVRISSFDIRDEDYDTYNLNRYLRTKRFIGVNSNNVIDIRQQDVYDL